MREAVIVSSLRTPVGRAPKGALSTTRPDDLAAHALTAALARIPTLAHEEIDDLVLGCALPEGEQGWDVARWVILRAGLPVSVPGVTVNRLCSSGLEAIAQAAAKIESGGQTVVAAGGVESMSILPFGGLKPSPNPYLAASYPASMLTMGLTAERVADHYKISREDQDAFALASHQKALAAQAAGKFDSELTPVTITRATPGKSRGKLDIKEIQFTADEGPRADSTLEALARLKPAFAAKGTVTAGNSSQTSDGAAISILMDSRRAAELNLQPLGRLIAYAVAGCLPEEMGVGPIFAIPKVLKLAGLTLDDIRLSSSTKPSPPNPSPLSVRWGSTRLQSTSTAEPSLSATLSAAPEPSSQPPCWASYTAAKRGMEWSPCASAAEWAQPGFSNATSLSGLGDCHRFTGTGIPGKLWSFYCVSLAISVI